MHVKICVCSFALLSLEKAVMFMSVRSFLALHLCWQPTALLQLLQSLKPAAALAGVPFLVPPSTSHLPPFSPCLYFKLFFGLDQKHIVTKPDWAPRRDKDWILRDDYKYVIHELTYAHTLSSHLKQQQQQKNAQPPVLKAGYFSDLSYCQNPPSQLSFMQGREQYKSRQPQSIWMYIHCHFRPWDVAFWLLPAKSRFKAMIPWVKWQTNPFCSVRPVEG